MIDNPILNSPFRPPTRHFALDAEGAPTGAIMEGRRESAYVVPVAAPRHRRGHQAELQLDDRGGKVTPNDFINELRRYVEGWRGMAQAQWGVTHETERLLVHWRDPEAGKRRFFCQLEAIETVIWLTEVAPKQARADIRRRIETFNQEANPDLFRIALKMATGSGKTSVMAMLIAWHAVNRARHPSSRTYTDAFLIVTPGITIKDRLRVLLPSDPENLYESFGVVPRDMLDDVRKARIVITNYHAFKHRETLEATPLAKAILQGRGEPLQSTESDGQMLQRVCAPLLGRKEVVVINDEAHHCYRERQGSGEEKLDADEKQEAKRNAEAARLWISGIEALNRVVGVKTVYDLSATPFFLRGSGYDEGTLFPWVVSDFSLMDAIESGIVKAPRLPVSDNQVSAAFPVYRDLYRQIQQGPTPLPRKGRAKQKEKEGGLDPEKIPALLQGALQALYDDYRKRFEQWEKLGAGTPPVFIVVCNNTSTSKLVYDHISGYEVTEAGATALKKGALPLFSNVGDDGKWLPWPRTLLIDSEQLDSGESLSPEFRKVAAGEIEAFRRELRVRFPGIDAETIDDETLLREVMNTVGKQGRLGEAIRCVVSVSMLTEGWDANTVSHILGVRAFGTQLLCEQVVGRGLRRVSYEADADGFFEPEYAEVLGIPFTFVATNSKAILRPPKPQTRVYSPPDREALTLRFPRVTGYRLALPPGKLTASFTADSRLTISPEDIPTETELEAIVGEARTITLDKLKERRLKEVAFSVAGHALRTRFRDEDGNLKPYLFPSLLAITEHWLKECLVCKSTFPQLLLWRYFADHAVDRIYRACVEENAGPERLRPILDPYNREGSTRHVDFQTTKDNLWKTREDKSPINFVVCDSNWESGFARQIEAMPEILAYAKNQNLNLEVPYQMGVERRYFPDFLIAIDDGDKAGPLNLIAEIKGYRKRDAQAKADTMKRLWVPAVNNHGGFGRWSFLELTEEYDVADTIRAHLAALRKQRAA